MIGYLGMLNTIFCVFVDIILEYVATLVLRGRNLAKLSDE